MHTIASARRSLELGQRLSCATQIGPPCHRCVFLLCMYGHVWRVPSSAQKSSWEKPLGRCWKTPGDRLWSAHHRIVGGQWHVLVVNRGEVDGRHADNAFQHELVDELRSTQQGMAPPGQMKRRLRSPISHAQCYSSQKSPRSAIRHAVRALLTKNNCRDRTYRRRRSRLRASGPRPLSKPRTGTLCASARGEMGARTVLPPTLLIR